MAASCYPESSRSVMTTKLGTKLSIITSSKTDAPADYIVCFVNEKLSPTFYSRAIVRAAGYQEVTRECDAYIAMHGSLAASQVFVSSGGERWRKILHVFIPATPSDKELTESILNCLREAHGLLECLKKEEEARQEKEPFHTIAFPSFESVSAKIWGQSFLAALQKFDEEFGGRTILNHIMIFEDDEERVSQLKSKMFKSKHMDQQDEPLRIVLVGKTGMGKSHTGNSILGWDYFVVEEQFESVTHKSSFATVTRNGCDIELVDTPGVFDTATVDLKTSQEKELAKSVLYTLPGPHIFIAVFRSDVRFTEEDAKVLSKMEEVFSKDICRFLIVVFTHTKTQEKLDRMLKNVPEEMKELLARCSNRVLPIDNGEPGERTPACDKQVDVIIKMAKKLREDNRKAHKEDARLTEYYTNDLLNRCLQLIKSSKTTKTLTEIKQDAMRGNIGYLKVQEMISSWMSTLQGCAVM